MFWLIVTILAYFFLAVAAFGDKFLLTGGGISNPKVYTFYVGILSLFVIIFIPFGFFLPNFRQIVLSFFVGTIFILGLYLYYSAVKEFEVSRIVPAVGGIIPILTFFFMYVFSWGEAVFSIKETISFSLLVFGSILIVIEKSKNIFGKPFLFSLAAAFYFSLYFVLAKLIYDSLTFINGFIWIRLGSFFVALMFLFFKEVREKIFIKNEILKLKTTGLFIGNQIIGGSGTILQNWAVSLAPVVYIAFINALQGIQYVFLLIFTIFFSLKFPQILKEGFSKEIIFQKIIAILLIGGGLILLTIKNV